MLLSRVFLSLLQGDENEKRRRHLEPNFSLSQKPDIGVKPVPSCPQHIGVRNERNAEIDEESYPAHNSYQLDCSPIKVTENSVDFSELQSRQVLQHIDSHSRKDEDHPCRVENFDAYDEREIGFG